MYKKVGVDPPPRWSQCAVCSCWSHCKYDHCCCCYHCYRAARSWVDVILPWHCPLLIFPLPIAQPLLWCSGMFADCHFAKIYTMPNNNGQSKCQNSPYLLLLAFSKICYYYPEYRLAVAGPCVAVRAGNDTPWTRHRMGRQGIRLKASRTFHAELSNVTARIWSLMTGLSFIRNDTEEARLVQERRSNGLYNNCYFG